MEDEPKKDPNEWALAYGDMITLLMTFFVLIIAMSGPKTDGNEMMKANDGTGDNLVVPDLKDSGIFNDKVRSKTMTVVEADDFLPPISDLELIQEDMVVFMAENELFNVIDLMKTEEGFTIRIKADILFDSGDQSLKKEYLYLLDKIAELLSVIPNNVRIEGHTDDRYNDDINTGNRLSISRASRVCDYMIGAEMLLSSRFGVTGHGRNRPIYPNINEQNRAVNRRVEIIIQEIPEDV
ncbi:MAG: OmpA family protein [Candidatus Scalindua sp.]|jgi:chemotaxis protein MotB|nr:OmpA family protein [Candidatus Scalindua sp.]